MASTIHDRQGTAGAPQINPIPSAAAKARVRGVLRAIGGWAPAAAVLTLLLSSAALRAHAQGTQTVYFDYPGSRQQIEPLKWTALPPWLRLDGELRSRTEGQTSLNQVSSNDRIYDLTRVRGGVTVQPVSYLRGYLQFQDTHALGLPLPQVASNMRDNFDLFQGYLDIHAQNLDVVTGRQLLRFGSERLVGISNWTNNSRSWDGFDAHYGNKNWVEAFATSVVAVHPTSLDKHGAGLTFYGAVGTITTWVPLTQIQPFIYIRRSPNVTSQQSIHGGEIENTFGAEVNAHLPGLGFEYDVLGALQRGAYSNDSIHSGAGYAKFGYIARHVPWKPRLIGEYDFASGNGRRNLDRISTFDQQYPSNHNAFGLVDLFGFQNITQSRANVDLNPAKNWTLLFQTEFLHVASRNDSVYNSGAAVLVRAPAAGFRDDDIGQGFDASTDYVFRKYVDVQLGVGHFFPGRLMAENGKAAPLTLGYFQLTYRFKVDKDGR